MSVVWKQQALASKRKVFYSIILSKAKMTKQKFEFLGVQKTVREI